MRSWLVAVLALFVCFVESPPAPVTIILSQAVTRARSVVDSTMVKLRPGGKPTILLLARSVLLKVVLHRIRIGSVTSGGEAARWKCLDPVVMPFLLLSHPWASALLVYGRPRNVLPLVRPRWVVQWRAMGASVLILLFQLVHDAWYRMGCRALSLTTICTLF